MSPPFALFFSPSRKFVKNKINLEQNTYIKLYIITKKRKNLQNYRTMDNNILYVFVFFLYRTQMYLFISMQLIHLLRSTIIQSSSEVMSLTSFLKDRQQKNRMIFSYNSIISNRYFLVFNCRKQFKIIYAFLLLTLEANVKSRMLPNQCSLEANLYFSYFLVLPVMKQNAPGAT